MPFTEWILKRCLACDGGFLDIVRYLTDEQQASLTLTNFQGAYSVDSIDHCETAEVTPSDC